MSACGALYHQLGLRGVELLARRLEIEPAGAVDLGELAGLPRARRPLQGERVGGDVVGVEIALDREGGDLLAALEPHAPELGQLGAGRQRRAQLLVELAQRARARVVALLVLALGDRPGAGVLARPERPARMDQQHLADAVALAVQEDPGAAFQAASGTGCRVGRRPSTKVGRSATSAPAA